MPQAQPSDEAAGSAMQITRDTPGLPRHVAIIMDGNGRWAQAQGKPRSAGHAAGAQTVRRILEASGDLGIRYLTLYSFSTENWSRSPDEVNFLMRLYAEHLIGEREELRKKNIRLVQIGRREGLPEDVLREFDKTAEYTADCDGPTLCLAVNYGSRMEITDAVRAIAEKVKAGTLDPADITQDTVAGHLYTAGIPDPDLLIRTAGEMRVSNYLLWQISYAEFYVSDVCWPDFDTPHYHQAITAYLRRTRKFGAVVDSGA